MYGLKIMNGDISVRGDGNTVEVSGVERITQEISHWLIEPLGTDKLYARFGSSLWDKVGDPMIEKYVSDVRSEVYRVVSNYVAYQKRQMQEDLALSPDLFLRKWGDNDIIDNFRGVDVNAVADTLYVTVKLTTASGTDFEVTQQVRM